MSGAGEAAERKFWRMPELVERLLMFLDTSSTSRLAKVHPLTREILQGRLGWSKLLRKSFPCKTIIHSEQDRVEIQHLTQILKNMENPKLRLLELLDVICDQCVPVRRSIIQVSCRSPGHISHSVSPFCFSLLEQVERALGTAEQAIEKIEVHNMFNLELEEKLWISALSSRVARQEGKVTRFYADEVLCKSPEEAAALHNLLRKSQKVVVMKLRIQGEIGEEGWTEIAQAVHLPIGVQDVRSSTQVMKAAKKTDLKTIWDDLKHKWIVDLSDGMERSFYKETSAMPPLLVLFCLPFTVFCYSPREGNRKVWSRLEQLLNEEEDDGSK